ncbi:MAG: hypothetical protein ACLQVF_17265 [Isosphaeraceae bacterium]
MRTIDRLSPNAAWARLHALVGRLARSLSARHPAIRWGLVLTVVGAFLALGYWAATAFSTVSVRYLASGARFSSEDLIKICRAFDERRITDYRVDDRRVAVSADDFDDAAVLLAKIGVGRHSIEEIRSQPGAMSLLWETSEDRARRDQLERERILEAMIGQQSGVVWSLVSLPHARAAAGLRNPPKPSAFVYLETEGDRQLPFRSVQAIPAILRGFEPDLNLHAITVMDRRGHRYLDPSNPSLGDISRNRAREEELSEKILEKLDWIKGVRVLVQVSTPHHVATTTGRAGSSSTSANPPRPADRSVSGDGNAAPGPAAPAPAEGAPAIVVNGPAFLEPEPVAPKPIAAAPVSSESAGAAGEPGHESGHVLVNVPRSFYYNALVNKADHLEPSPEEFQLMAARTETGVKKTVELVLPEQGSWRVDVDTIPDELPLVRPALLPYPAEARRKALDWGIVGAVGAAISILAAVGSWIQVARRSARPPQPEASTARYRADPASDPGPSERVRELVRRNPAAAASVLQRWTVQGGSAS